MTEERFDLAAFQGDLREYLRIDQDPVLQNLAGVELAQELLEKFVRNPNSGIVAVAYDIIIGSGHTLKDFFDMLSAAHKKAAEGAQPR